MKTETETLDNYNRGRVELIYITSKTWFLVNHVSKMTWDYFSNLRKQEFE